MFFGFSFQNQKGKASSPAITEQSHDENITKLSKKQLIVYKNKKIA